MTEKQALVEAQGEPCKTCGGSRIQEYFGTMGAARGTPCPDCSRQPASGDAPARSMTDGELASELSAVEKRWDEFQANLDEGHAGSPGEWMVERMDELRTEQKRRAGDAPAPDAGEVAWRVALVLARDRSPPATEDMDDKAYWRHELNAFDRAYDDLEAVRPDAEVEQLRAERDEARTLAHAHFIAKTALERELSALRALGMTTQGKTTCAIPGCDCGLPPPAAAELAALRAPGDGDAVERMIALVGKHLGPHLAIAPTPRYEAVVRNFARAAALAASGERARAEADTERLDWLEQQARKSPTGITFDYVPNVDGAPSGFRFMRRHFVGEPCRTLRQAVDRARTLTEGGA